MKQMSAEHCHEVEAFKFRDIVYHWARERLVHEVLVARELAKGVIREGLRFQSVDPKWAKPEIELRGEPLVGYSARQELPPILIRTDALAHLLAVEKVATDWDSRILTDEIITRNDFRTWLIHTGRSMPAFWFDSSERHNGTTNC